MPGTISGACRLARTLPKPALAERVKVEGRETTQLLAGVRASAAQKDFLVDSFWASPNKPRGFIMSAITINCQIVGHGTYSATADQIDALIARLLPNSVNGLRKIAEDHCEPCVFTNVHTVTEFLFILADTKYLECVDGTSSIFDPEPNPMRTTLKVGDKVINFRKEEIGTVVKVEVMHRQDKSDKVVVELENGSKRYNYHSVWSRIN